MVEKYKSRYKYKSNQNKNSYRAATLATHRFTYFLADHFREIWTRNVNRRHHENFWNRISKFFWKGAIFPQNLILGVLQLIIEGPEMYASQWLFSYNLQFFEI